MMRSSTFIILVSFSIFLLGCDFKKSKSEINVEFTQDTLAVGYTYWWSQTAPFNGECTTFHSLVFTGTITDLKAPNNDPGPLYTSQEGLIEIDRLFKIKNIGENNYGNQKFISTDCFSESNLKKGDMVLVFCYDYENGYTIPGAECIVKIDGVEDPLIKSIRKFIDADDNPLAIKKDIGLWDTHGLGRKLEASIECSQEMSDISGQ